MPTLPDCFPGQVLAIEIYKFILIKFVFWMFRHFYYFYVFWDFWLFWILKCMNLNLGLFWGSDNSKLNFLTCYNLHNFLPILWHKTSPLIHALWDIQLDHCKQDIGTANGLFVFALILVQLNLLLWYPNWNS